MPRLAVFPKGFMEQLVKTGSMSLIEWIKLASKLNVDGLEFYSNFIDLKDSSQFDTLLNTMDDFGLSMPMMCCSPDFTHPDVDYRLEQIELEKSWIDLTASLGGKYCRVLTGQRRPDVSIDDGLKYAVDCINECLTYASNKGITLILENHYKDDFWEFPEFAQYMDVFCDLIDRIDSPRFGINYDPSNTLLAGEDPLELLERVKHRVVTMHASDRFLRDGSWDDLRLEENTYGYADRLEHGVIGKGLIDYDAIFQILYDVGFDGWISIEDGVNGMGELEESVRFLRKKLSQYWPNR